MPAISRFRSWLIAGAVAGGVMLGAAGIAAAATGTTTATSGGSSTVAAATAAPSTATAPNPATVTHGPGETLLTDPAAAKVKAVALAAVPRGTIVRVETDSAGSAYEAHVKKADGTYVTVKINSSFTVTATQQGFGGGPPGSTGGAPAA